MKKLLTLVLTICLMFLFTFAVVNAADDNPDPPNGVIKPIEILE